MEEIIIKECTHQELSRSEKLKLEAWLKESQKNRQVYAQMRLALLYPDADKREQIKDEVWSELKGKLSTHPRKEEKSRIINLWWKVAAVLLLCFSIGITLYKINTTGTGLDDQIVEVRLIEKVSLPGQKITTTLPDGTVVVLNADSKLTVPERFTSELREVTLQGEAFFDVARDEHRPFIIRTRDIDVEVLGTSFNVRSYPTESLSEVAVATGKVAVSDAAQREQITPGEKIVYTATTKTMVRGAFDEDLVYGWKDNILLFRGNDMNEIMPVLKRWYGVEFEIENSDIQLERKFSGRYKDPSLRGVLEGLSFVYDFNYEIEGKTVILK